MLQLTNKHRTERQAVIVVVSIALVPLVNPIDEGRARHGRPRTQIYLQAD